MQSQFLNAVSLHSDWKPFLTVENRKQILRIESLVIPRKITPPPESVLRFLEFPLGKAKIIILGQDPYPHPGAATGRAFEVGNLSSWNQPFKNSSLKNILRDFFSSALWLVWYAGKRYITKACSSILT